MSTGSTTPGLATEIGGWTWEASGAVGERGADETLDGIGRLA
jgi:hypothetical protein